MQFMEIRIERIRNSKILIENFSNKEFYYALAKFTQENLLSNFAKQKK